MSADAQMQIGSEPRDTRADRLRDAVADMKSDGMTFFRVTEVAEHGVAILEGWKERPDDQGRSPEPWLVPA